MNNEIKKLTPAVSYVCTKTQKWQKYEAFIIEELALDDGIEIVFEYDRIICIFEMLCS